MLIMKDNHQVLNAGKGVPPHPPPPSRPLNHPVPSLPQSPSPLQEAHYARYEDKDRQEGKETVTEHHAIILCHFNPCSVEGRVIERV